VTARLDAALAAAVERIAGARVVASRPATGGYTNSANHVVALDDGRSVFVKAAGDELTRGWLRDEGRIYASVSGPFMPDCLGFADDDATTALVLEDLSAATWPPPWTDALVHAVRATLDDLRAVDPPPGLRRPADVDDLAGGWAGVAADPAPFLALGLCSPAWLDRHVEHLVRAAERAPLDGDHLLHFDVRSDNLCVRDRRCIFVDWNQAVRGNPLLDLVLWLPSLHLEGGPPPQAMAGPEAADLAAVFAGYLALRAGRPEPPTAPPHGVRPIQRAQLEVALPWVSEALGLEPPRVRA
jgi:hypothetical protein